MECSGWGGGGGSGGGGHFGEGGLLSRGSHVALMFSPQSIFQV